MQEYTLSEAFAPAQAVDIPAFGGKLDVSWNPRSQVTQWGGLAYFVSCLKTSGLFDRIVGDAPFRYRSPNAPEIRDVVGTAVLAIVCGFTRYVHVNRPGNDAVLAALLGLGRIVCEDSVRRALKSADGRELDAWLSRHERDVFDSLLAYEYVLDVDNTVKPVFGHREGAETGYSPRKPGRPGHNFHSYFIGSIRISPGVDVQPEFDFVEDRVGRCRDCHAPVTNDEELGAEALSAGGRRQAPGADDVAPDVHGRRRAARRQRAQAAPAPDLHAPQGGRGSGLPHADRRVHETDFRNCGAVGLQSRLGADSPCGIPQMARRESAQRAAPEATCSHRLRNAQAESENRSRIDGSGRWIIASSGDLRHPTAEFRWNVNFHAPPPTPTSNSSKHLHLISYKMRIQCGILFRLLFLPKSA